MTSSGMSFPWSMKVLANTPISTAEGKASKCICFIPFQISGIRFLQDTSSRQARETGHYQQLLCYKQRLCFTHWHTPVVPTGRRMPSSRPAPGTYAGLKPVCATECPVSKQANQKEAKTFGLPPVQPQSSSTGLAVAHRLPSMHMVLAVCTHPSSSLLHLPSSLRYTPTGRVTNPSPLLASAEASCSFF